MEALGSEQILRIRDAGAGLHPLERDLSLLQAVMPALARPALARLSIGTRDALLLDLYRCTFPGALRGFSRCPDCRAAVEFSLSPAQLALQAPGLENPEPQSRYLEGWNLRFRPPNTLDLMRVVRAGDPDSGRSILWDGLVHAEREGQVWRGSQLPETIREQVAGWISELDPQADLNFSLSCAACAAAWQVTFDIGAALWTQIVAAAESLLDEVDQIARVYHWSQAEILGMSVHRRRQYLARVAS